MIVERYKQQWHVKVCVTLLDRGILQLHLSYSLPVLVVLVMSVYLCGYFKVSIVI